MYGTVTEHSREL